MSRPQISSCRYRHQHCYPSARFYQKIKGRVVYNRKSDSLHYRMGLLTFTTAIVMPVNQSLSSPVHIRNNPKQLVLLAPASPWFETEAPAALTVLPLPAALPNTDTQGLFCCDPLHWEQNRLRPIRHPSFPFYR